MAKRRTAAAAGGDDRYRRHRDDMRERMADASRLGRDIGPLPEVEDPERREACRLDFKLFCETYFADTFCAPWSEIHLQVIERIEYTVLNGGLYAIAMPRGMGKSSLCGDAATTWAIVYGHHQYVMLVCATDDKFLNEALAGIKTVFETNDLLLADFPEVCYPIRKLEGENKKAAGQHIGGERTNIGWKGKRLIFPTVAGSAASGSIIGGGGLQAGTFRGTRYRRKDGTQIRPTLVLPDDPQTDESAESIPQCIKRERLISATMLGMAGPGKKIAALATFTVIKRGDLADRMCDREKHPEWHGTRTAMLTAWPKNLDKWQEYKEILHAECRNDEDLKSQTSDPHPKATAFYLANRQVMDDGAAVSWEYRKYGYELSPIQHAMHHYFRDAEAFWSEYQNWLATPNAPADPDSAESLRLDRDKISIRISGFERKAVPTGVRHLTCGIDCHDRVLTWKVCALEDGFSGYIVDKGTYPETERDTWEVGSFRPTLAEKHPKAGPEGALTAGLTAVTDMLFRKTWKREDGAVLQMGMGLCDTGYLSAVVRRFIASSGLVERLIPSFGRAPDENEAPISSYKQRSGEQLGDEWLIRLPQKGAGRQSGLRHVLFDANHWKTFAARRLLAEPGDAGAILLYGTHASIDARGRGIPATRHDFWARHLCSEQPFEVTGRRKMTKWRIRPGETNNHWWDNFVQCLVAGSILGLKPPGSPVIVQPATSSKPQRLRVPLTGPDGRPFFISDR